jgi:putative ABC transport system permease protein
MAISFIRLGFQTLVRDWRAGELKLLWVSVSLAVAALTAVGFLADRIEVGLQRDARQLLGGDAVVASDQPTPPQMLQWAHDGDLRIAATQSFPTMSRATPEKGGATRLVALKAVTANYPLRGRLTVAADAGPGTPTRDIPAAHEAWVDDALLLALGLQIGDTLLLGESSFKISRRILNEPDRGGGFMNFAPRVLINQDDLGATELVQAASRMTYRLLVAGDDTQVTAFMKQVEDHIKTQQLRGIRVESLQNGRPEMTQTLERAQKFLNLVALLAALLSAVAVALAARTFALNHLNDCAMLRVLGVSQATMARSFALEFFVVGCLASALGVLGGYAVHTLFVSLLAGLVDSALPQATLRPVAYGLGMGLTLLLAFGLPPVLQLAQVPALRVIRRDVGNLRPTSLAVLTLGVGGFAALLLVVSSDIKLGLIAVGGFAGAVLLFALASWLMVMLLRRLVNESTAPRWLVLATRQICARPIYAVLQVSSLSVGLLALVLLVLLRTDLISSWRQVTPVGAPDRFVINIQPDQGPDFKQALQASGVNDFDWYPMIRGRLVEINGQAIGPETYTDERAKRLIDREFNLSNNATLPAHNQLVAGRWQDEEAGALSVEEGIAKTLNLRLNDRLTFEVAGVKTTATISSLRKVDWGSMRANFFVIYPVANLPDVPRTFMSAFKAPPKPGFDNQLVAQFPNITQVDTASTVAQIQRVLNQVIGVVELLFGFTLAAGLVVLFAAVTATREERAREYAIMRAVGASAKLLQQVQRAELMGVGLLSGTLASVVAMVVGWVLAKQVFGFDWTVSWWVPLLGALAGAVLALAAGWWGLREVLRRPVVDTLRRASNA